MIPPSSAIIESRTRRRKSLQTMKMRRFEQASKANLQSHPISRQTFCILHLTDLMRQADSLAPPTQPTSPEKKRLKPRLITEYVQNISPSTNLIYQFWFFLLFVIISFITEYVQNISPSTNLVAIPIRKLPKKNCFLFFLPSLHIIIIFIFTWRQWRR